MVAPAPGWLSTTRVCPSFGDSFSEKPRVTVSTPPPGGYGAITLMGLAGQAWLRATEGMARTAADDATRRRRVTSTMVFTP